MSGLNLRTPAEGILETHVSWDEIEEVMQKKFHSNAVFGPDRKATNIGEGNGFLSRMCLIEPDWIGKDNDELPEKFVVKICSQLTMIEFTKKASELRNMPEMQMPEVVLNQMEKLALEGHNAEVAVYEHMLEYIEEGKIPRVKIYGMRKFTEENRLRGYIVMSFVENLEIVHIFKNVSIEAVKQPLRALAIISAMSLRFTPEERSFFITNPFTALFGPIFHGDVMNQMWDMMKMFQDGVLAHHVEELQRRHNEIVSFERMDAIPDQLGMERVLCHGDCWSMNMLWTRLGGELSLAALIDYQTSHFGSPAADICRLLNATLSGADRREHWEELVEYYYQVFEEEAHGYDLPFTLEQLKEAYRRSYPLAGFMVVFMIAPLFESVIKTDDEEEKAKIIAAVIEKTTCMFEDMFMYHDNYVAPTLDHVSDVPVLATAHAPPHHAEDWHEQSHHIEEEHELEHAHSHEDVHHEHHDNHAAQGAEDVEVHPSTLSVAAHGDRSKICVKNPTSSSIVFKVKSSDNVHYKVKPVYGFVEPLAETSLEIVRLEGSPSASRFVIEYGIAADNIPNASSAFLYTHVDGRLTVAVKAE